MTALLGEFLVLDLDRGDPGGFIALDRVMDVEQPAIAGVAIGDDRCGARLH
jgi:hypothetical protein